MEQHGFESPCERFGGSCRQDEEVEDSQGDSGKQRGPSTLGDAMAYPWHSPSHGIEKTPADQQRDDARENKRFDHGGFARGYGDALAWVEAPSAAVALRRSLELYPLGASTNDVRELVVFPQDAYPDNSGPHDYTRLVLNAGAPSSPGKPDWYFVVLNCASEKGLSSLT